MWKYFLLGGLYWLATFGVQVVAQEQPTAVSGRSVSGLQSQIEAKVQYIQENNRTTTQLTEADLADLPIGIAREYNGTQYIVAIDSAVLDPRTRTWFVTAYASLKLPGTTTPIAFAGRHIAINEGGIMASSETRLALVSTHYISVNESVDLLLPGDGRNYLTFDCSGFKAVNLKGIFHFQSDVLIPDQTLTPSDTAVQATFEVNTSDLNNLIIATSISPFQIKGLNDFSFSVRNAVVDMSDEANPSGFSFPQDYQQGFGENILLWRGFYLSQVQVTYHGLEQPNGDAKKMMLEARNLIIDDAGVSGWFSGINLLTLDNGSIGGWPFSIDQISVKLTRNRLTGGGLGGMMGIPFLGKDPVTYQAEIEQIDGQTNYRFAVQTNLERTYTAAFGEIRLNKGCIVAIEKRNGVITPSASLNGVLSVGTKQFQAKEIAFEKLVLSTQKPYILSGMFAVDADKQSRSMGFPIQIDSIQISIFQGQVSLGVQVALNIMNKEDKPPVAKTYIQILAKQEEQQVGEGENTHTVQRWKLDKVRVNDITIQVTTQAFGLTGRLTVFDQDPVYGDGFRGSITFTLKKILERGIQVNAYFGSKNEGDGDYRYWHFDAYAPTGRIPLVPPLQISGIMGGASYHMKRTNTFLPDFNALSAKQEESATTTTPTKEDSHKFEFVPDQTAGLSFMAGVTLIAGSDAVFNSDVVLDVGFNDGGGLRHVQFIGTGYFFTKVANRGRNSGEGTVKAPVYARLNMLFDNNNDVFHANLQTYVNVAGVVRGVGANGLVGECVIHVDRSDWYIYIGRASQMLAVEMAGLYQARTYFMIGTKVENLPLPPPQVREVFDKLDTDFMRDENALSSGKGFAFGVRFDVSITPELGPFYAFLKVGAGADVMLRNYGDAQCRGRDGRLGMDGWYASGQAYVYLAGGVGIKVKRKRFDIARVGAAALLQAKLPNPTWMQGGLAGSYSILGGLVKGKFSLTFTVGETCEIISGGTSDIDDIEAISELKPDQNAQDVSVFATPQVAFNLPINKEIGLMNQSDELNTYRVVLDDFSVQGEQGTIQATITWNTQNDVAVLRSTQILPPQQSLKVVAKVHWEKKMDGRWEPFKDDAGQVDYETKYVTFTTGAAPDFIPDENIAYTYPVQQQYNFYKDEYGQGYMKMHTGMDYLLTSSGASAWKYIARFQTATREIIETPLNYDAAKAQLTFDIPKELAKGTVYKLSFVKQPQASGQEDANVSRSEKEATTGSGESTMTVRSNTLTGTLTENGEKDIYTSAFRCSIFETFAAKIQSISGEKDLNDIAEGNIMVLGKTGNLKETFDEFELRGKANRYAALVQVTPSTETKWYKEYIFPAYYQNYPVHASATITYRNVDKEGVPPLRSVGLSNDKGSTPYQLTDAQVTSGVAPANSGRFLVGYWLSWYVFYDSKNMIENSYRMTESVSAEVQALRSRGIAKELSPGVYPFTMSYQLPGIGKTTYSKEFSIRF